jgi:Fe2+ or Zn2+ uptake regulation protein
MHNFNEILKKNKYKVTPARIAILEIFSKNKIPLNAEIIHNKIKKDKTLKEINEVTIYRTLTSFEEKKILKRVDMRKESIYFELNNDHHHHILCTKCNLVEDFKNSDIEKMLDVVVQKSNNFIKIKEHSFELFGFCKNCSN